MGDVTADLLGRIGMKVDYVATDWGTVSARRAKRSRHRRAVGTFSIVIVPVLTAPIRPSYRHLVTSGDGAWFGWPKSDEVMADIAEWYACPDLAAESSPSTR